MISLDADAPFVRAVRAIKSEGNYDHAIEVLVAAEQKHGIRIIHDDGLGSLATTWVPINPSSPPTLRQIRELLAHRPKSQSDWEGFWQARRALYREADDDLGLYTKLFPFLTETSLLIGGTDFANGHWIEHDGVLSSWSQRAWGQVLADWAIERGWRPSNDGTGLQPYAFFCYYLYEEIPDYEDWAASVLEVIRRKCERQLDPQR